jgi:hypothetical protein
LAMPPGVLSAGTRGAPRRARNSIERKERESNPQGW